MPWDATRLRVADGPGRRDARRGADDRRRAGRVASSSRPGARRASSTRSRTRPAGGTCTRSTARTGSTGRRATSRRWTPSSASPRGCSGAATYAFLADGAILAVARADGRDGLLRIEPDGAVTAARDAVHGGLRRSRPPGDGAVAVAAARARRARLVRLTARRRGRRACSPARCPCRSTPAYLPEPEPIAFATAGGATARALYFAPTNPAFRGPDGERPPLIVHLPRRADGVRVVRAVARPRVLHLARHRGGRRRLPRLDGLRAAVPRRAQGPVGDRRRRRLRRGRPVPRRAGGRGPRPARHPGRQRRRLHDARRARVPARRVRGRHQPLRDRRPRADPPRRPQVRVALRRGPDRPVDAGGPRGVPRPVADPLPRPDARPDAAVPGHGRQGRAAVPAGRDGGGVHRARPAATSRSGSRGRATGSAGAENRRAAYGPSSRSSPGSSGSRPPTTSRRWRSRGWADTLPDAFIALPGEHHEHPRRARVPVHVGVGHRRPSRQDVRPDLGRHPRQHPRRRRQRPRRLRDRDDHRPRARVRRDHDVAVRRVPERRPRHGPRHRLHEGRVRLRLPDLRHDRVGQGAEPRHRAGRGPVRAGRRRPGDDVRVRVPRDAGADAAPDRARAPDGAAPGRGPQVGPAALPAARRQDAGHRRVRPRRARSRVRTVVVSSQQDPDDRGPHPRRHRRAGDPARRSRRSCGRWTR